MLDSTTMTNFDRILAEATTLLSEEEQRKLSDALLERVPERDLDVDAAWMAEAHRRRAEWKAGKVELLSAEDALGQMFSKA